jgi:hypothetical protein
MDGGDRVGFQHLVDQLVVGRDLGEPRVLQLGRDQVREPLTEQIRSARGTEAITRTDLTDPDTTARVSKEDAPGGALGLV